jgi:hypothetical protein
MRRFHKAAVWAASFVIASILGGRAFGDSLQLHYDPGTFSDGADGGGEFEAYNLSTGFQFADPQHAPPSLKGTGYGNGQAYETTIQKTFQTFCTEDEIFFYPDQLYFSGSATQTHDGRPLTPEVAYLYDKFWHGTLPGYSYTFGALRSTSAQDLQEAIWHLMADPHWLNLAVLPAQTKTWVTDATDAVNGAWGDSIHSVRLLQLSDSAGLPAQDQLVEIAVPLPSAAWGGAILLGAVGAMKVRRRAALA